MIFIYTFIEDWMENKSKMKSNILIRTSEFTGKMYLLEFFF